MSETTTTDSPFRTTAELAALIRRKPQTVRMMRHRGTGPRGTRVGRDVLYHVDEIQAWLARQAEADHIGQRAS